MGDATTALEELADLAELEGALRQDYPGARMDDIDEEAVRRALGRQAVDDLSELRRIEAELERQGYLKRRGGSLDLTPKAVRRLGETALRRVFAQLDTSRKGDHDQVDAGQAGELTGASRPWRSGDEQPLDVIRTLSNAMRRGGIATGPSGPRVRLEVDDFEVLETERRTAAAVCLLVDLSYSMALRGTWGSAKQTALALHTLVASKYPQDAIQIIGFSNYARELQPDGAGRPRLGHGAGHEPPPRADDRRPPPRHVTPSTTRSCWSSPTASRRRTCCATAGRPSTGHRPARRWS